MPQNTQPGTLYTEEQVHETAELVLAVMGETHEALKEHCYRVANGCALFCKTHKLLSDSDLHDIYMAGLLHDCGYVSVPVRPHSKEQNGANDVMLALKKHPVVGAQIVSSHSAFSKLAPWIRHHHEAFDGSGYPDGIKGEAIPIQSRIMHLFDSFDEMTTGWNAGPILTKQEALSSINERAGREFDPQLIARFIQFVESDSSTRGYISQKDDNFIRERFAEILQKFSAGKIVPPAMPKVVTELRKIIRREDSSTKDLADVLEKDPVISLRLISIAKSPAYKGYGDVKTVQAAIPRLGFKETLSIVVAVANKSMYEAKVPQYRVLMDKLWVHSLASAYSAKFIAQSLAHEDPETLFLMGLTHDIGKVVLLRAFAEGPQESNLPVDGVMAAVQDAHQTIGNLLLKRWGFGEDYARVVALHEGANFSEDTNKEILTVHLANIITRKVGFSFFGWDGSSEIVSAKLLGISAETIEKTEEMVKEVVRDLAHLF